MSAAASSPIRTDTPPRACRVMIVIAPAPPAASRHAPNAAAMAAILLECIGYSPQTAASMAFRLPSPGRLQYLVHLCQVAIGITTRMVRARACSIMTHARAGRPIGSEFPPPPFTGYATIGNWHHLGQPREDARSEEHTSELQSLMRISYAVFCLKK